MGTLSRADVELLDRNLQDLTDTGLKRQGLKIAQQRADQEHEAEVARELTNRRLLDAEERRGKAEDARLKTQAEGTSDVWLKGPKGGEVHYRGGAEGLQKWLSQGAVPIDKPKTAPIYGTYKWTDPDGADHTYNLRTPEDVENAKKLREASGIQKKQGTQTREIANKLAYDKGMAEAQRVRDEEGDTEKADQIKADTEARFGSGAQITETQHLDEVKPKEAVPPDPGSKGIFGFGAKAPTPGTPAVTAQPKRDIVIRHPKGWTPGAAPAAAPAPAPSAATNAPDDLVPVLNPSGKPVKIKRSQLPDALNQGYKQR